MRIKHAFATCAHPRDVPSQPVRRDPVPQGIGWLAPTGSYTNSTFSHDTLVTNGTLTTLIERYKADPESVYNTWFVGGEQRMKAFRSIRRGVKDTCDAIAAGRFGNDFKGSPLEVVLNAITEQKDVFEGAAHPFYWKPKLRIPDIYENDAN